jgi:undecaprenyl-phosphate 4-deoxy-4-formamido-L-arabinose transferase
MMKKSVIALSLGVAMFGIGLIGEYVGRTYQVVRARQRYYVRETLETKSEGSQ